MRHLTRLLRGAALGALILSLASVTAAAAVRGNGNGSAYGNSGKDDRSKGNLSVPSVVPSVVAAVPVPVPLPVPGLPPGQAKKTTPAAASVTPVATTPAAPIVPPGQAKKAPADTSTTPATSTAPATADGTTTTETPAAPTPVPPAVAPVIGESMGLKPVAGTVQVRLPQSSGYVSLAAAGSVPSGAVVDAREGTVVLRSAIDASGHTQTATIRGAIFEVRQSASGKGMTDLVLRGGQPRGCPAAGGAAIARAALAHPTSKAKPGSSGLWAQDDHGRFRTRGRNSVATVRGTRWVTRETCAGTLTKVMEGAVDVSDLRKHHTVRVRAGHSYLARTSG